MTTLDTEDLGFVKEITKMSVDFDRWYTDVVRKAEIADWSGIRGCMVILPYGYAVWEHIQRAFDDLIRSSGHENWAFPLLIPRSNLMKEAEHVEGFAPQVAWVTKAGGDAEDLEEWLAVRPTSETIIGPLVKRYIQSHRDLPKLTNQWCSVFRWEMRSRLLLRTREFWWQEGHTFHATAAEAEEEVHRILEYYRQIAEDWLAVPVLVGRKSEAEKFPGAVYTTSIEGLMRDGLALQMGTSHYFGQNFSTAYDISFTNRENERELCYTTSWGMSTRTVGGLVMAHGDDRGLVMPPKVAPVQAVSVPIFFNDEDRAKVEAFIQGYTPKLEKAGLRHRADWRDERPGDKFNHWELKGVPLRLEVGPKDVQGGRVTLVDRLAREKTPVPVDGLERRLTDELEGFQRRLFERAQEFVRENSFEVSTLEELIEHFKTRNGFVWAPWCGDAACEARVKEKTGATTRAFPENQKASGRCLVCGRPARHRVAFARAY